MVETERKKKENKKKREMKRVDIHILFVNLEVGATVCARSFIWSAAANHDVNCTASTCGSKKKTQDKTEMISEIYIANGLYAHDKNGGRGHTVYLVIFFLFFFFFCYFKFFFVGKMKSFFVVITLPVCAASWCCTNCENS